MNANATPDYYADESIRLTLRKNITKTLNEEAVCMMEEIETSAQNSPNQKTVIVQGYSMWYSYWNPENSVQNFIVDLEKALPVMNKLADITCYIWMPQRCGQHEDVLCSTFEPKQAS
ncbi:hypothetical protein RvY_05038-4 [Ramazzottius varieornatus]|uniref:Uncharacterized protein n=1 Tax=Ramazzottius varieornatus TaxID=947166 RepID=A0A1D1UX76_RAMVA|nr:hypothetical protein RvY_05038-4 [Ramazzottius varieornatus]